MTYFMPLMITLISCIGRFFTISTTIYKSLNQIYEILFPKLDINKIKDINDSNNYLSIWFSEYPLPNLIEHKTSENKKEEEKILSTQNNSDLKSVESNCTKEDLGEQISTLFY